MLALSQFVSGDCLVARHHVVVLGWEGDYALILPTVSIDAHARHAQNINGEVSAKDCALAGWPNRCKFVPQDLQWVPRSWIAARPGAALSKDTWETLQRAAQLFGPRARRHTDAGVNTLQFISARKDKKRIAA